MKEWRADSCFSRFLGRAQSRPVSVKHDSPLLSTAVPSLWRSRTALSERVGKDNNMSVFLLSFVLFVLLASILGYRDLFYARYLESEGNAPELLP